MAKATKKQALGRGLSALLNNPSEDINSAQDTHADKLIGNILEIPLKQIEVNPFQPRTQFNEERLTELANSIKELGIIQPITVRKLGFQSFQLVSGERRFRAAKLIGLESLPTFVRIANDQESLEMALVENIQRQDLDPIEVALSYQRLIEEIGLTQDEMSERVGKNRSTISNYMRLLKLDPLIQTGMRDGFLSMGHGRALINIENHKDQLALYEKILAKGLSVRATEAEVQALRNPKDILQKTVENPYKETEKTLAKKLALPVSISKGKQGRGKISISFADEEELQTIIQKLSGA